VPDRYRFPVHTAAARLLRSLGNPERCLHSWLRARWTRVERSRCRTPSSGGGNAGVLAATIKDRQTVAVTYQSPRAGRWEAHVAVLGFGVSSSVKAGENRGRKLLTTSLRSPRNESDVR
jgi:hypothetical protein